MKCISNKSDKDKLHINNSGCKSVVSKYGISAREEREYRESFTHSQCESQKKNSSKVLLYM